MTEILDQNDIRYLLEERWEKLGYDRLLEEERDFILIWWLEAESSNGSLHQYFFNSAGDSAVDALESLNRLGAKGTANVLQEAMALFGDVYPKDRQSRNEILNEIATENNDGYRMFDELTDRLFIGPGNALQTVALDRVGDAYARDGISSVPTTGMSTMRTLTVAILLGIMILLVALSMFFLANTNS